MSNSSTAVTNSKKIFRQDINALRAWAVISVVFYHFGVLSFSGGFLGVDIFFVISGFLMTGIIVSGLEKNKFSIADFYFSRIKRIIPALVFLCVILLLLGWFLLAPDDYQVLAKHVKDSLLFVSNNTYRKESGYFDAASHEKWLLHTWSLSVEWQFYVILPIILAGSWLVCKKRCWLLCVVFVLFAYSFVSCIYKANSAPTVAFYLIKYRCWEMLAGGLVFFSANLLDRRVFKFFSGWFYVASLIGISAPVFFVSTESAWPGCLTLIPVFSAALFLFVNKSDVAWVNGKLVTWTGERSYSIYLWHWPTVVLLDYFQMLNKPLMVVVGILVSFGLAELSYKLIEIPFRRKNEKRIWLLPIGVVVAAACIILVSLGVIKLKGLPNRVDPVVVKLAAERENRDHERKDCVYGSVRARGPLSCSYGDGDLKAIVLGDSHAAAAVTAVRAALPNNDGKVLLWSRAACPFIKGATAKIDQDCNSYVSWVLESIKTIPLDVPVILIQRSSLYVFGANEGVAGSGRVKPPIFFDKPFDYPSPEFLEQFRQHAMSTMCEVAKSRKMYWVQPIPELKVNVPQAMARAKMRGVDRRVELSLSEYNARHKFILSLMDEAEKKCGIKILNPVPYMCDDRACYGDNHGWPIYFDDNHLSESGNKLLAPMFKNIF